MVIQPSNLPVLAFLLPGSIFNALDPEAIATMAAISEPISSGAKKAAYQ